MSSTISQRQPAELKATREGRLHAFPYDAHHGDGLGLPPTNRKVVFRGMTWLTFKNGVIVEGWDSWNLSCLLDMTDNARFHV